MEVIHRPDQMRRWTMQQRSQSRTVGLVPTMGALHEGHLSLVRESVDCCHATAATVFVNPTQFGPAEDLDQYPRTLQQDLELLEAAGAAAVFVPDNATMYPDGFSTYVDPPEVAKSLEGVCRPVHFRGVTTIVTKLFHIVPATHAYFGRKDYQQWKVIETLARDLDFGIEIVGCETVRDADGLAMSSRNRYLTAGERNRALLLSQALNRAADLAGQGVRQTELLETEMRKTLLGDGAAGVDKIDYAAVVHAETLAPLSHLPERSVALIAAWVGNTRLIDNRVMTGSDC